MNEFSYNAWKAEYRVFWVCHLVLQMMELNSRNVG